MSRLFAAALLLVLLTACAGDAVVFAPTPPPPDRSPVRYRHPSGAFSISVPPDWALYEQNATTLASAAFSLPGDNEPSLLLAAIKRADVIDSSAFGALIDTYQAQIRPDIDRYTEYDRQPMGDGSWRLTGRRTLPGGASQTINTFLQTNGAVIGLAEVVVPDDAARAGDLLRAVNSFALDPSGALETAPDLAALSFAKPYALGIIHVATWTTPDGVLFVTGEVANYGGISAANLPVEAVLVNADGAALAGAVDVVMGHGVSPGGFAPFSLRFGGGQPVAARRVVLTLGGGWQPDDPANTPSFAAVEDLTVTRAIGYDPFGRLTISGEVTNVGTRTIRQPRTVVTLFDARQNVIGAAAGEAGDTLAPGERAPYTLTLTDLGGEPVNYIVTAQGLVD